jgi:hypothetical protein
MDVSHASRYFLEPKQTFHRQYEALRAIFVENQPLDQVAERFGYKPSALRSMASRFRGDCRQGATPPFFSQTDADVHLGLMRHKIGHVPKRPKSRIVAN